MRTDEFDLLVERRFGDFAFLQIHYQPVVSTEETDVQTLFELIPLAADHNTVAVAVGLRTGNHWRNKTGVKPANPLEQIDNLLVFKLELDGISQVLILAAATLAEVRAERFDPVGRGSHNPKKPSPGEALLYFRDLRFHDLAPGDERNEDDKVLHPGDPFAAEGNIANRQGQLVAYSRAHAEESRKSGSQVKGFSGDEGRRIVTWLWREDYPAYFLIL
jgi:hypothetical protein